MFSTAHLSVGSCQYAGKHFHSQKKYLLSRVPVLSYRSPETASLWYQ
jgi:hypothetical protein